MPHIEHGVRRWHFAPGDAGSIALLSHSKPCFPPPRPCSATLRRFFIVLGLSERRGNPIIVPTRTALPEYFSNPAKRNIHRHRARADRSSVPSRSASRVTIAARDTTCPSVYPARISISASYTVCLMPPPPAAGYVSDCTPAVSHHPCRGLPSDRCVQRQCPPRRFRGSGSSPSNQPGTAFSADP